MTIDYVTDTIILDVIDALRYYADPDFRARVRRRAMNLTDTHDVRIVDETGRHLDTVYAWETR